MKLETQLRSGDLFDQLGREEEQEELRRIEIKSGALEVLIKIFEETTEKIRASKDFFMYEASNLYTIFLDHLPKGYTGKDIELLSVFYLPSFEQKTPLNIGEKYLGIYFSVLMNACSERSLILHFPSSQENSRMRYYESIHYVGYRNNGKHITIKGNGGFYLGMEMESGKIIVEGDVGDNAGLSMGGGELDILGRAWDDLGRWLHGGKIRVKGDAGNSVGAHMDSGSINVHGNVGYLVGYCMNGGGIHIYGNAGKKAGSTMRQGELEIDGDVDIRAGRGMRGGRLHIHGSAGMTAGLEMKDGELIIDGNISRYLGLRMKGGIIRARKPKGVAGSRMSGGCIYAEHLDRLPRTALGGLIYEQRKLVMKDGKRVK